MLPKRVWVTSNASFWEVAAAKVPPSFPPIASLASRDPRLLAAELGSKPRVFGKRMVEEMNRYARYYVAFASGRIFTWGIHCSSIFHDCLPRRGA